MSITDRSKLLVVFFFACAVAASTIPALGQLIDKTKAPNIADEGINKSLTQQIGAGRGDWATPDSSSFIIARDPFRAIRRGRQLFQRKFTRAEGNGPVAGDGLGDMNNKLAIGAGLTDSCAACHGRPRGSAEQGACRVVCTSTARRPSPLTDGPMDASAGACRWAAASARSSIAAGTVLVPEVAAGRHRSAAMENRP